MDKNQLLQAFSQFLDQMGHDGFNEDYYGEDPTLADGNLPIWSQLDASVPDESKGPIHSRNSLFKVLEESAPFEIDTYGMPRDDAAAEFMIATGMI